MATVITEGFKGTPHTHLTGRPGGGKAGATPSPARQTLAEPDAAEMAVNLAKATAGWVAAGFPVVDQAEYDVRSAACGACELWDGAARFGLGKCKAPGCGCTKFKRWLKTEACKHPAGSKWPA